MPGARRIATAVSSQEDSIAKMGAKEGMLAE